MNKAYDFAMILILVGMFGCQPQTESGPAMRGVLDEPKDLVTFHLPRAVTEVSAVAQSQFLELLPYNTPRFQVKPRFVLMDRSERVVGPSSAMVDRLNFLHVVYFREGSLVWQGSLLYGQQENPLCSTGEGFHLGVRTLPDQVEISFQDGERQFQTQLSPTQDSLQWLESKNAKVFVYHYVVLPGMLDP